MRLSEYVFLTRAKGMVSGVAQPACWKVPHWKWSPVPVSAKESNGNNTDNSGTFNCHRTYADNGDRKKDLGA